MTAQRPFRKTARRARRSSIGHGGMHPNVHLWSPIRRQFIAFDAVHRSFNDRATVAQLAASVRTQSANSPAALKFP
jgi:hypothetical protein